MQREEFYSGMPVKSMKNVEFVLKGELCYGHACEEHEKC